MPSPRAVGKETTIRNTTSTCRTTTWMARASSWTGRCIIIVGSCLASPRRETCLKFPGAPAACAEAAPQPAYKLRVLRVRSSSDCCHHSRHPHAISYTASSDTLSSPDPSMDVVIVTGSLEPGYDSQRYQQRSKKCKKKKMRMLTCFIPIILPANLEIRPWCRHRA